MLRWYCLYNYSVYTCIINSSLCMYTCIYHTRKLKAKTELHTRVLKTVHFWSTHWCCQLFPEVSMYVYYNLFPVPLSTLTYIPYRVIYMHAANFALRSNLLCSFCHIVCIVWSTMLRTISSCICYPLINLLKHFMLKFPVQVWN